jgi:hypothetical protein
MTNKKIQSLNIAKGIGRFVQFREVSGPDYLVGGTASKIYKNTKKTSYKK